MPKTSQTGRAPLAEARGFTLLELMVALSILALLAAALPLALNRTLPSRRAAVAGDALIEAVARARALSAASGEHVHVRVTGDRQIAFSGLEEAVAATRPMTLPAATSVRMLDREGRTSEGLTVFPDGSTSGVHFEISSGERRTVVAVSELTGRVRFEPDGS